MEDQKQDRQEEHDGSRAGRARGAGGAGKALYNGMDRSKPDDRWRLTHQRKVRTPQGSAPGNARSGQPEGQWHRKYTAFVVSVDRAEWRGGSIRPRSSFQAHRVRSTGMTKVRVKRCGK